MRAYVFGYGSLVNRETLGGKTAHSATLSGWRRAWRHTHTRDVAYLTILPDPETVLHGLIAAVDPDHWPDLDAREEAYARLDATDQTAHGLDHPAHIAVYSIAPGNHAAPTAQNPILLSYLDVVVQGYFREFGEPGVAHFFDTTTGWDAPILDDRANPRYPRHQRLSAAERALVDHHLALLR